MKTIRALLSCCLPLLFCATAAAQPVIRIVVPFAAGGVQDILARILAPDLGVQLGRTVIVENRTGAGGTIANAFVAKAPPDGTTLILSAASHTITGHVYAKLPYHPINDFTGVAHVGTVEYVLMVSADIPAFMDRLIERILFLEGLPNLQDLDKLLIGENVREMLECDLRLEQAGITRLREAVAYCESVRDFVSRDLFSNILEGEEDQVDFIETQLGLIDRIGLENYTQLQSGSAE